MGPKFVALEDADLDQVNGGMRWENFRPSENIEDRRPQSDGGPVPNSEWQAEQDSFNNSCWMGADGHQYSGDSDGGEPYQMPDYGGGEGDGY